jgi:hypothetical protein
LIKTFYTLLNNKKMFDRESAIDMKKIELKNEASKDQTFKPALAPKTNKLKSVKVRNTLSQERYSSILSQRSPLRLDKLNHLK